MIASEPNKLGPVYYGTDFTQFDAPNDDNTQITSETINSGNVAPILSEYNLDSSHLDHLPSMEAISVEYNEGRNNLFEIDSIYSENNIDKYHQEESSILSNSDSGILPEDHGQPFNDQHVGDDMDSMWEQIDGILNEESRRATQGKH